MKKFKLSITESVNFNHEVIIETDKSENEVDRILDEIESKSRPKSLDDYMYELKSNGLTISEYKQDADGYNDDTARCEELEEIESEEVESEVDNE